MDQMKQRWEYHHYG